MPNQKIIQRRSSSATATLPVTYNDAQAGSSESERQKHHRRNFSESFSPYNRNSAVRWAFISLISMTVAFFIWKPVMSILGLNEQPKPNRHHVGEDMSSVSRKAQHARHPSSPLAEFSELSYALQNSDLVALYFAAAWCPMSTPVSLALDDAFGQNDLILSSKGGGRKTLSIVYVSSDKTIQEYSGYLHDRNWLAIPFESEQRSQLKKHFSTCAHRELEELGIDRKHEIPTIIVIDSETQGIITTSGADDVDQMGSEALDHWKDMRRWLGKVKDDMS